MILHILIFDRINENKKYRISIKFHFFFFKNEYNIFSSIYTSLQTHKTNRSQLSSLPSSWKNISRYVKENTISLQTAFQI